MCIILHSLCVALQVQVWVWVFPEGILSHCVCVCRCVCIWMLLTSSSDHRQEPDDPHKHRSNVTLLSCCCLACSPSLGCNCSYNIKCQLRAEDGMLKPTVKCREKGVPCYVGVSCPCSSFSRVQRRSQNNIEPVKQITAMFNIFIIFIGEKEIFVI